MRPKFVAFILVVATLVLGVIFLLRPHKPVSPSPPVIAAAPVAPSPAPTPTPRPMVVKRELTPEERQAAIDAERDRLYAWQMSNDPQSLSNILGDLISEEKEIREAAIEATKEFGSTNAIPVLKALAATTEDNEDAIAMLKAVEFLSMPPGKLDPNAPPAVLTPEETQIRQQRDAARNARRDARNQRNPPPVMPIPDQNGQP